MPALFGYEITSLEHQLFSLSVRFGGLGLSVPTASAVNLFTASRHATQVIVGAIKQAYQFQISVHYDIYFFLLKKSIISLWNIVTMIFFCSLIRF